MTRRDSQTSVSVHGTGQRVLDNIAPDILADLTHFNLSGRVIVTGSKFISGGAYGDVSSADCELENRGRIRVALKCMRFYLSDDIKLLFEKEIYVWSKLRHNNILPLIGYTFDERTGYPILVSEWMENGSAWSFVKSNPDCDILHLIIGVAEGLNYLHGLGIVHSDIKSDNVLVSRSGNALICDFGCSRMINSSKTLALMSSNLKGTPQYLAYELIVITSDCTPKHTKETDVWAFGMTIYELFTRRRPYESLSQMQVLSEIMSRNHPTFPSTLIPSRLSRFIRATCELCWTLNPEKRPIVSELLAMLQTEKTLSNSENGESEKEHPPPRPNLETKDRSIIYPGDDEHNNEHNRRHPTVLRPVARHSSNINLIHRIKLNRSAHCVRYSPDGKLLAIGCSKTVRIYSADSGRILSSIQDSNISRESDICGVCFSRDRSLLATGSENGQIRIWAWNFLYYFRSQLQGHSAKIHCLCFTRDSQFLVSGAADGTARIWSTSESTETVRTLFILQHNSQSAITSIAVSPDNKLVITWSLEEKTARIWHLHTGICINRLPSIGWSPRDHVDHVYLFAFTSNDTCVAIGKEGKRLARWDISASDDGGRPILEYHDLESISSGVLGCAVSCDIHLIATGLARGYVQFENRNTGEVAVFNGHDHAVVALDFSPMGESFVTASRDKSVKIWKC